MHKNLKAFTLVELIIVVAIITVLSSISFISMSGETSNARDAKRRADLQAIDSAIMASNAQNRELRYTGHVTSGTAKENQIEKNVGKIYVLRNAKMLDLNTGFVPPSLLPKIARDPKGDRYLGAFLTSNMYMLAATLENADTKISTALVVGTFQKEAVLDRVTSDVSSDSMVVQIGKPGQFVTGVAFTNIEGTADIYRGETVSDYASDPTGATPDSFNSTSNGDIIRIDNEEMAIFSVDFINNQLYVIRGWNDTTIAMHNQKAEVALVDYATGASGLFCVDSTNTVVAMKKINSNSGPIVWGAPAPTPPANVSPAPPTAPVVGTGAVYKCDTTSGVGYNVIDNETDVPYKIL